MFQQTEEKVFSRSLTFCRLQNGLLCMRKIFIGPHTQICTGCLFFDQGGSSATEDLSDHDKSTSVPTVDVDQPAQAFGTDRLAVRTVLSNFFDATGQGINYF